MASSIGYEYMNEDSINHSLKCGICDQPFVRPVSTNCKKRHTFCRQCIEQWVQRNPSCPSCRQNLTAEDLISITEDIVVDVLTELQVKCTGCGQTGIKRGDFNERLKKSYPMVSVCCSAKDIKCPWMGPRNQLASHLKRCAFESLRPLIVPMISENQDLREQLTQLISHINKNQREVEQLKEQLNQQVIKIDWQHNEIMQFKSVLKQNGTQSTSSKYPSPSECTSEYIIQKY